MGSLGAVPVGKAGGRVCVVAARLARFRSLSCVVGELLCSRQCAVKSGSVHFPVCLLCVNKKFLNRNHYNP